MKNNYRIRDFRKFLEWNKTGKLDYKTPIVVEPPAPVETLDEKIRRIVRGTEEMIKGNDVSHHNR